MQQTVAAELAVQVAEAELFAARAHEWVTARPGLWYAPCDVDRGSYVVGCNGVLIGRMWPGPAGNVFGDWTCAPLTGGGRVLGPFRAARVAAARLAFAVGALT